MKARPLSLKIPRSARNSANLCAAACLVLGLSTPLISSAAPSAPGLCSTGGIYTNLKNPSLARCVEDCGMGADCTPQTDVPIWLEKPAGSGAAPLSGIYDRFGNRTSSTYTLKATRAETEADCETQAKAWSAAHSNEPAYCVTFSANWRCANGAGTCDRADSIEVLPKISQHMKAGDGIFSMMRDRAPEKMVTVSAAQLYASRTSTFKCDDQPLDPADPANAYAAAGITVRKVAHGFKSNGEPLCRVDNADICVQAMSKAYDLVCPVKGSGGTVTPTDVPALAACGEVGAPTTVECPGCKVAAGQTCADLTPNALVGTPVNDGCGNPCPGGGTLTLPTTPSSTPSTNPSPTSSPSPSPCDIDPADPFLDPSNCSCKAGYEKMLVY